MTAMVDALGGVVVVTGHLTVPGADSLRRTVLALRRDGHARVLLDLTDVQAVDFAGLRVLRNLQRTAGVDGVEVNLVPPAAELIPPP
jgi:anti-anti-sigma regulatory factor